MKSIVAAMSLVLLPMTVFASETQKVNLAKTDSVKTEAAAPTRALKAGESYLLTTCAAAGDHPNPDEQINAMVAKGKIVMADAEIDPPYRVSAPGIASVGNEHIGWSWCTTVTLTKE